LTKINWMASTLLKDEPMENAVKNLNIESTRIVLVIDDSQKLLGTITDGDIRRAILENKPMDTPLHNFMNPDPTVVSEKEDMAAILKLMQQNDLLQIPIVDSNSKIVGLETLHHLIEKETKNNPVFLMAGGFGKRLAPLTDELPKPLLKVGSKPILEIIMDKFIDEGFSNFYISTHFLAEKIVDHFGDGSLKGVSIEYIHEKSPMGTAGALGLLPQDKINSPIIMMNGDLLSKVNFRDLLSYHNKNSGEITMCISEYEFQVPYGVINIDKERLKGIDEKPSQKFFINAGIYVVEPSVINRINDNEYIDMPTLLDEMIENDIEINVFPIHEYWLDVGRIDDFNKAKEEIAKDDQQ